MSTLITSNLKNTSSSGNNIVLNADGTCTPGFGKILQVQHNAVSAVVSGLGDSFNNCTGMGCSITPIAATSTILCFVDAKVSFEPELYLKMTKTVSGTTSDIATGATGYYTGFTGAYSGGSSSGRNYYGTSSEAVTFQDSVGSAGVAQTYQLQWREANGNTGSPYYLNASVYGVATGLTTAVNYNPSGYSSVTLMEIGV